MDIWILTKKGRRHKGYKRCGLLLQLLKLARIERVAELDAEDLDMTKLDAYLSARGKLLHQHL